MKTKAHTRSLLFASAFTFPYSLPATDISLIPIMDGETLDCSTDRYFNRFGGKPGAPTGLTVSHTTANVHSGNGALLLNTNIVQNGYGFTWHPLTGLYSNYIDSRSFTNYVELQFWLYNATGASFTLGLELKDYTDSNAQKARKNFSVGLTPGWRQYSATMPVSIANGWSITGSPDFDRARFMTFVIEANVGSAVSGAVYLDDVKVREAGGVLDHQTAPINDLATRLTKRQFLALFGCRDRTTGLIPINNAFADIMAMNSTAGVVHSLDRAIKESWITEAASNTFLNNLVAGLHQAITNGTPSGGGHIPPRYVNRVFLTPAYKLEESPVDAAVLFLGLYKHTQRTNTNALLRQSIQGLLDRFDFSVFASMSGWKLALDLTTASFTAGSYDGYSGEVYLISLAAALSQTHRVPLQTLWNSGVFRVNAHLVNQARSHLTHTYTEYRAPFMQWIFPILVDTRGLGPDNFPIPTLAANPLSNAILYQKEVHARLAQLLRPDLFQKDAVDNGSCNFYRPFSEYNQFSEPDLISPWSCTFSLLADPAVAEVGFRKMLSGNLTGPFGLADAVHWATGAAQPSSVPARQDFWNTTLSTMALEQFLYHENALLTSASEVKTALATVFAGIRVDISRSSGLTTLSFPTEVGVSYEILRSLDLNNWAIWGTLIGTGKPISFTAADASAKVFYRVVTK